MKLYYTKRSPYARKVRIMALEKAIPLDLIDEDLANKSLDLCASHPLGKVPTLVLDNGYAIYDSVVICQYLESLNKSPQLIPHDALARIDVLKWEALADDMVTTAIVTYMEKVRHPQEFNAAFINNSEASILKGYDYMSANLKALSTFNLASIACACAIGYIHFRLPHLTAAGSLAKWFEDLSERPSLKQTIPIV